MHINDILKVAVERKASDVHLKVGAHPVLRIDGRLQVDGRVQAADAGRHHRDGVLDDVLPPEGAVQAERSRSTSPTRCPVSAASAATSSSSAARSAWCCALIPSRIQTFKELMLPPVLEKICRGAARSGPRDRDHRFRQVDHAGVDDRLHQRPPHRAHHDDRGPDRVPPPRQEVDHQPARGRRRHAAASRSALRSALRQDPDVILVGEMRDYETIETALLAAETGHLVLSTLHTLDATETVNRIISVFPPHQQKQIRIQLGGRAQGDRLDAPAAARRRPRPGAGDRGADRHRLHPRLHREQGEDQAASATPSTRAPASTACRPSTSRSTCCTRTG